MSLVSALLGGIVIGLSAALLHIVLGRIAGISGIVGSLLHGSRMQAQSWRVAFVVGLVLGGAVWIRLLSSHFAAPVGSTATIAIAGLLVGFGSRLGSGCTSGHGVCGLARFSIRSIVATTCFVFTGVATVALS